MFQKGPVAQWIEHWISAPIDEGSNPSGVTNIIQHSNLWKDI